jgi:hypothetical protein
MIPKELLSNTMYGPAKGMPVGYKFEGPQLPEHLKEDYPPLAEEMEKVEKALKNKKEARRDRKAKGMQSQVHISRYAGQFGKPAIPPSVDNLFDQGQRKSFMTYPNYPENCSKGLLRRVRRDSSDSLISEVLGLTEERQTNKTDEEEPLDPIEESLAEEKVSSKDIIQYESKEEEEEKVSEAIGTEEDDQEADDEDECYTDDDEEEEEDVNSVDEFPPEGVTRKSIKAKICHRYHYHDMNKYQPPASHVDDDLNNFRIGNTPVIDSRECIPYPDVTYSLIRVPEEIDEENTTGFYRRLAMDEKSISSDDDNQNADENEMESDVDPEDESEDEGEDEDEQAEEEEEEYKDLNLGKSGKVLSDTSIALDRIFTKVQPYLDRRPKSQRHVQHFP